MKEVRKVDDYTVDIETNAPLPILPNELVQLLIMDKGWSEKNSATEPSDLQKQQENFANRNANGTGPFSCSSRATRTRKTVLDRQPRMVGQAEAQPDRGRCSLPIKSDATRTSALLRGAVDASIDRAAAGRRAPAGAPASR